jgi:hypothetical protein
MSSGYCSPQVLYCKGWKPCAIEPWYCSSLLKHAILLIPHKTYLPSIFKLQYTPNVSRVSSEIPTKNLRPETQRPTVPITTKHIRTPRQQQP